MSKHVHDVRIFMKSVRIIFDLFNCLFGDLDPEVFRSMRRAPTKVQCLECSLIWCFQCHSPWHDGIQCKEFRRGDRMLKKWAREVHYGQHNAQQCPSCKVRMNFIEIIRREEFFFRFIFNERKDVIISFVYVVKQNFVTNVEHDFEILNLSVNLSFDRIALEDIRGDVF